MKEFPYIPFAPEVNQPIELNPEKAIAIFGLIDDVTMSGAALKCWMATEVIIDGAVGLVERNQERGSDVVRYDPLAMDVETLWLTEIGGPPHYATLHKFVYYLFNNHTVNTILSELIFRGELWLPFFQNTEGDERLRPNVTIGVNGKDRGERYDVASMETGTLMPLRQSKTVDHEPDQTYISMNCDQIMWFMELVWRECERRGISLPDEVQSWR